MRSKLRYIVASIASGFYNTIEPWLPYYSQDVGPMTDEDMPKYLWYLTKVFFGLSLLVIGTIGMYTVLWEALRIIL